MFVKSLAVLTLASLVGLGASFGAEASPRFTVENTSDDKIKIFIYNGGDQTCTAAAKTKKVSPGETETYGCTGNGKGKCKVRFFSQIDGEFCKSERNTCSGKAIKLDGGSTTTISWIGHTFVCEIDDD